MIDQKEQILQIAYKMFLTSGVRNVSIDEVCSELRISKKTFYTHFTQKEDLVDAVLTYHESKNFEKYEKNLNSKNAIDLLIFIIREIRRNTDCEPHLMWHDIKKFYPKVYEKHDNEKLYTIKNGFEQNLLKGIAEGYYREDLDVELAAWFHTIQIKNTFGGLQQSNFKYSKKRLLDFFIDLIIHLIANEKGLKYIKENYLKE